MTRRPCILDLPEHTLQVPYENYRKVFRTSQKNIERELGAVVTAANELSKQAPDSQTALTSIDGMISRVEMLKRKVCVQFILLK